VRYHEPAQTICCDQCQLAYPVRDDIPVMLVDEARPLTSGDGEKPA